MAEWLLLGHVLAAMAWLGGWTVMTVLAGRALRASDDEVRRFVANLRVIGPRVLGPATGLLALFGLALVIESDAWDFGQGWIRAGLALFAVALVAGAAFLSRAGLGAERAVKSGDLAEARRQVARWAWGGRVVLLVLVVATWDMVFKP